MADFAAYGGADDMISQILATTPNSSYTFSFWLNTQDGFSGSFLTAKWDGTTVLTISPSDPEFGWTQFSFTEKATGSDTISFAGQNGPGGIYLDTVNVTPVPDGGLTFAMLGTAMTGLALARRKF